MLRNSGSNELQNGFVYLVRVVNSHFDQSRINDLSIAAKNADTAGDPHVACQNSTNSTTESNRTGDAGECVATALGTFVLDVNNALKLTIHRPVLVSLVALD